MLDHPARIDAHVVGHHVARQPDPVLPRAVAQACVGPFAAEVLGDPVVIERIGRGDGVDVAAHPLDLLGRFRALPQADQPESRDAPASERLELVVGDRVERPDVATVRAGQLVEPDVGALRDQHDARHPGRVRRERLEFLGGAAERRCLGRPAARPPAESEVHPALLLGEQADRPVEAGDELLEPGSQERRPMGPDVAELAGQRGRGVPSRRAHQLDQRDPGVVHRRAVGEGRLEAVDRIPIARTFEQGLVVDELADRSDRRVLVGHAGQEQFLEALGGGFRLGAEARELLPEPVEQAPGVGPEARLEVGQGGRQGVGPAIGHVPGDEQVSDLVEQPERADVTGLDRRRAGGPGDVHPVGETADPAPVGDDQVAARADQRTVDRISLAGLPPDVEVPTDPIVAGLAHRGSMARPPRVHRGRPSVRRRHPRPDARRRRVRSRGAAIRVPTGRSRRSTAGSARAG